MNIASETNVKPIITPVMENKFLLHFDELIIIMYRNTQCLTYIIIYINKLIK